MKTMETLQTIQQMMEADPTIQAAIIDGMEWEGPASPQEEAAKWGRFSDVGLFKDSSLPPFKKASEIPLGVKYPIRAMEKLKLKHGQSVS